jgi:hypothetical protein
MSNEKDPNKGPTIEPEESLNDDKKFAEVANDAIDDVFIENEKVNRNRNRKHRHYYVVFFRVQ